MDGVTKWFRARAAAMAYAAIFMSLAGSAELLAQTAMPRTLVENGQSVFAIVIPAGADEIDRRAASILQDAFFKMSGARLSIEEKTKPGRMNEILIGFPKAQLPRSFRSSLSKLKPDGFLVTLGRNL